MKADHHLASWVIEHGDISPWQLDVIEAPIDTDNFVRCEALHEDLLVPVREHELQCRGRLDGVIERLRVRGGTTV
jgi:hypothetical protein